MEKLEIQVHDSVHMLYIDIDKQGCHPPLEQNKSPIVPRLFTHCQKNFYWPCRMIILAYTKTSKKNTLR